MPRMIHSRAYLFICKEFQRLQNNPPKGISAILTNPEDIFNWTITMFGPLNTIWEGGILKLTCEFDENFNDSPPKICFITIPFHPNVDVISGSPSIPLLEDLWRPDCHIDYILLGIQNMLANPIPDPIANIEAADMFQFDPESYKILVKECVNASQKINDENVNLMPYYKKDVQDKKKVTIEYDAEYERLRQKSEKDNKPKTYISKVSFDDYHATWRGIATSKAMQDSMNPHLENIKGCPRLQALHHNTTLSELQEELVAQSEKHKKLMYGITSDKPTPKKEKGDEKLTQIEHMRRIYLARKTPSYLRYREQSVISLYPDGPVTTARTALNWKYDLIPAAAAPPEQTFNEADDLVRWTKELEAVDFD